LLLEEVPEGPLGVVRADGAARGVALHGDHQRKGGALVARALVGDALDDRLHALEAPRRLEMRALAAGVQLGAAVGALRERVGGDRQHAAALGAARGGLALENPERSPARRRRPRRLAALTAALGAGSAVALLLILAVARASHALTLRGTS